MWNLYALVYFCVFRGNVLIIVNVIFGIKTHVDKMEYHINMLENLQKTYGEDGLVVLGFLCTQFMVSVNIFQQ